MRKMIFAGVLVMFLITVSGCETVAGISKDLGNTARNIGEVLRLGKDIHDVSK